MRLFSPVLFLLFFLATAQASMAQYSVKLKYEKYLPKSLYTAPTAALISYASNSDDSTEVAKGYQQLLQEVQEFNQKMGLQIVMYADFENESKEQLAQLFNQKGVTQLLFINKVEIVSHGTQDTYRLLITKFNNKPSLISENQKAFALQGHDFEQLTQTLSSQIALYAKSYFNKGPNLSTGYQAAVAISKQLPQNEKAGQDHPRIILSPEDLQRGIGGYQGNFFFRTEGDLKEINAGFFGQELRPYASQTPASLRYLNKYRAAKWAFVANKAVMFGAIIGYGYEVSRDYSDYFNDRQKVYLGIVAASFLSNHFITKKTNYNFKRAVDEYNVWTETKQRSSLGHLAPSGLHLGFIPATHMAATIPSLSVYWKVDN